MLPILSPKPPALPEGYSLVRAFRGGNQGHTLLVKRKSDGCKFVYKAPKNPNKKNNSRLKTEGFHLGVVFDRGGNVPRLEASSDSPPYLLMQFVEGDTLQEYIENEVPIFDSAIKLFSSLADTIRLGHTADSPVLHRDIKPGNMIVNEGKITLLDYGLSFSEDQPVADISGPLETVGNRWFPLPEQKSDTGLKRDHRSDICAICGILFLLLTGKRPTSLVDGSGLPPHMRDGSELPFSGLKQAKINSFFDKAFAPELDHRFQSIEEMLERLAGVSDEDGDLDLDAIGESLVKNKFDSSRPLQLISIRERYTRFLSKVVAAGVPPTVSGFKVKRTNIQWAPTRLEKTGDTFLPADHEAITDGYMHGFEMSMAMLPNSTLNSGGFIYLTVRGEELHLHSTTTLRKHNAPTSGFGAVALAEFLELEHSIFTWHNGKEPLQKDVDSVIKTLIKRSMNLVVEHAP